MSFTPSTIILEANRNNACWTAPGAQANAFYRVQISDGTVVTDGDTIYARMASLESQEAGTDTVIISDDTTISMLYSIYDVDYSTDLKRQSQTKANPWATATFDYYAAYNDLQLERVDSVVVNIIGYVEPDFRPPPYSRNTGGSFVIDQSTGIGSAADWFQVRCRYLDANAEIQSLTLTATNATKSDPLGWQATGPTMTITAGLGIQCVKDSFQVTGYGGNWVDYTIAPNYGSCPAGTVPPSSGTQPVNNTEFSSTVNTTPVSTGGPQLDIQHTSVLLRKGAYDKKALAVYITQLFNSSNGLLPASTGVNQTYAPNNQFLQRTDSEGNTDLIFRRLDFTAGETAIQFTDANSYAYSDGTNPEAVFVGATQFAIDYGSAGNVFSLNYAHMPMVNEDDYGTQNVLITWTGTVATNDLRYYQINQASGIVIHDLQPVSFWRDQIGLYDQLIVPLSTDGNGIKYYLKADMEPKITYGFASLDQFILKPPAHTAGANFRQMVPIPPTPSGGSNLYIDVTGQTRAILGSNTANAVGGYYLIEVLGLPGKTGSYKDDEGSNPKLQMIASKQYSSQNVVTVYADSGIPYKYKGSPAVITELTVRILNPDKTVCTDLGANNTVWIQIDKEGPVQPLSQTALQGKNDK